MQVPRQGPRRRTVLFAVVLFLIAVLVIATFTAGQGASVKPRNDPFDKRNKPPEGRGEIEGKNPANDCWAHHLGEGMRDTVIVYPIVPQQVKLNAPYVIPVQILNPWKQELREMELDVTLLGEQKVVVEAAASNAAAKQDVFYTGRSAVGPSDETLAGTGGAQPRMVTIPFNVPDGVSMVVAHVELAPRGQVPPDLTGGVSGAPDIYEVKLIPPSASFGTDFNGDPQNQTLNRSIVFPANFGGFYNITVDHRQGFAYETDIFVNMTAIMGKKSAGGGDARTYSIPIPISQIIPKNGEPYTAEVPIVPFAAGPQAMEFHVRAQLYYKHQLDGTPNEDYYNRYANLSGTEDFVSGGMIVPQRALIVGDSFVASKYGAATASAAEEQWQLVLAEMTGFAAAALLLPSLLLGGTYGKASRKLLNNMLGGAKRRVMFHNLSSLALSLVAVVHICLFILEIRYTVLMGVMWGGLSALSLLILGLTGYYQVPLIQRHGYKWWRFTHLVFGLLVVVFLTYHMVADGPDFFFLKERIPQWINDINLAQK